MSTLFALKNTGISIKYDNIKKMPGAPSVENGQVQRVKVEESTRRKQVKLFSSFCWPFPNAGPLCIFFFVRVFEMATVLFSFVTGCTSSLFIPVPRKGCVS